ncbi:MAG: hypothetical protein BGP06_21610 [Rhizobiales bacterium 65-9]|nr:SDR family oxidoreductase [Hyphomicrobiales bacterium]OJY39569.1 MAG: hypothetical protein BGP06_21610 [Rhizobiales bacterium 65-9]
MAVAMVTGGGRGLGLAASVALAEVGFTVAVADLSLKSAEQTAASLPGGEHRAVMMDVADEASVISMFDTVEDELGPVSVLATFAGILIERDGSGVGIAQSTIAEWQSTIGVNATGTFLSVREMLRRRQINPVKDGRIITVSSLAAQIGSPRGGAPYVASKGAVLSLTKLAAIEGAPLGVTANCIAPGMIETAMLRQVLDQTGEDMIAKATPLGRIGQPAEIGAIVTFLASRESGFITGATIDVNGGRLLR